MTSWDSRSICSSVPSRGHRPQGVVAEPQQRRTPSRDLAGELTAGRIEERHRVWLCPRETGVAQEQQGGDADRAREQDRTEGAEDTRPCDDPARARPHGPRCRSESRIVREDRALELLQFLARF